MAGRFERIFSNFFLVNLLCGTGGIVVGGFLCCCCFVCYEEKKKIVSYSVWVKFEWEKISWFGSTLVEWANKKKFVIHVVILVNSFSFRGVSLTANCYWLQSGVNEQQFWSLEVENSRWIWFVCNGPNGKRSAQRYTLAKTRKVFCSFVGGVGDIWTALS